MTTRTKSSGDKTLREENAGLRARLNEAEEMLHAIRSGAVDALVAEGSGGPQLYTLRGLEAESNRFRGEMLAQVSDAVIATDLEQRVTFINAAAQRQYCVTASDVLGRKLDEIYTLHWPNSEAEVAVWTALRKHDEWRGEVIHRTHDGRELNVESSVTTLRSPDGTATGQIATIRDITGRKQSEKALRESRAAALNLMEDAVVSWQRGKRAAEAMRESEERLRMAVEGGRMGTWDWDLTTDAVVWSPRQFELFGISPEEFTGRGDQPISTIHPEDGPLVAAAISRAVERQEGLRVEFRVVHPDGKTRWLAAVAKPIANGEGRVTRMIGVNFDITGNKQVEEALRGNSERLALLSDAAGALLSATDPGMFLNGIFARLSELLGFEICLHYALSASGKHLELAVGRGLEEEVLARFRQIPSDHGICGSVTASGKPAVLENVQRMTDTLTATIRSLGLTAYACYPLLAKGTMVGTLSFGTRRRTSFDPESLSLIQTVCNQVATAMERKLGEEALQQAHDKLEQRVVQRTAELNQINNRLTQEIAERSNAELALRRQAALLNMTSDAVIIREVDGPIRYWNQGAERLYGFTFDEAKGRRIHEMLKPVFPKGLEAFQAELASERVWSGEITQTTKTGQKLIVESHQQMVQQPDGSALVLVTNHDITERVALHEEVVAAAERERERIGQNLHDGLCQLLTAARLKADSLVTRLAEQEPATARSVKAIANLIVQSVDEAYQMARGLEPVEPMPEGLMSALHQLATSTSRLFNATCTCEFPRAVLVPDHKVATELFRIAQEATNNAIKHGHAAHIRIRFGEEDGAAVLSVVSDGKPFPKRQRSLGMGLKTMRFRAGRIGATIEIKRGLRKGTIVRCVLPGVEEISTPANDTTPTATPGVSQSSLFSARIVPPAPNNTAQPKGKNPTP